MRYLLAAGGAALVVLAVGYVRRVWRRQQPDPALEIHPPRYMVDATGQRLRADESLQVRSRQRRDVADAMRSRAANLDAGAKPAAVLKMAKR